MSPLTTPQDQAWLWQTPYTPVQFPAPQLQEAK
jgi:hypothetical protein